MEDGMGKFGAYATAIIQAFCWLGFAPPARSQARIDFGRDVQPILKANCYTCHGPAQQMGGLRLDRRKDAMRGGTIPDIGPGNSDGSRLYKRLLGNEFGPQMPLTGPLKPDQVQIIKNWIDQGAVWPDELSGEAPLPPPDPAATRMMDAIRNGDHAAFKKILSQNPKIGNSRGPGGSTPLMYAAMYGEPDSVRAILEGGANPNFANYEGATPLMWAAGDLAKVELLVDHGAAVNAQSDGARTALLVAAGRYGNYGVVKFLLDHGADPNAHSPSLGADMTPLGEAAYIGDVQMVKLLIERGADVKAASGLAVYFALEAKCAECVDLLIKPLGRSELNGIIPSLGPPGADARQLDFMLDHGADVNSKDFEGHTLLMLAAASDAVPAEMIGDLIKRGVDANARDPQGHTALDFALRRGPNAVADRLKEAGGKEGKPFTAEVVAPVPAHSIRAAVERSLPLLQANDEVFLKKSGCVSCHNNVLTSMSVAAARDHGFSVDERIADFELKTVSNYLSGWRDRAQLGVGIPGDSDTVSYILLGLAAGNYPPDASTEAQARFLKAHQEADGHWFPVAHRPPIEASAFVVTAASMHAIQIYGPKSEQESNRDSVRRASVWLEKTSPESNDDRAFQLLGLGWAHADKDAIKKAARGLLAEQRADGGWAQLPSLKSDAYATGEVLVALKESGALTASDAAYQKGTKFLLQTQLADGSWYVQTHALRIQPYFESGFPHGRDQFISAAATNWATKALALAVQR
jgi:ankyrin repeat protein